MSQHASLELLSANKSFGGWHKQYCFVSESLQGKTRFAIYLPPQASPENPVPVLYWLSGLTCTDENFMQKAGAQRVAAELGLAIVAPDTSPRGEDVPDAPDQAYDLGLGAGFYLNATQAPWEQHYKMYDFVVHELPELILAHFPVSHKAAISGHSMGGHGALTIGLKNPERYTSISAFSPISNPINCPWGQKAFQAYLGEPKEQWEQYDASCLMRNSTQAPPCLVDQGLDDDFLDAQLKPQALLDAANASQYPLQLRQHPGYDHSYYFIASFIEEHLRFHHKHLNDPANR